MTEQLNRQFIISLDYEVFFGKSTGTARNSLITPTQEITKILERHGAKLSLFVDAGYLVELERQGKSHPKLLSELGLIRDQLSGLTAAGHEIQLHIHPHWMDSHFDGSNWHIDPRRYRLQDFSHQEQVDIVSDYKNALAQCTDAPIFAYRAGGWCLQPFDKISPALKSQGIWLDSTVYENGLSEDPLRWYDFRAAPRKPWWRFEEDPVTENKNGFFAEIPISSMPVNPLFYWISTFLKKILKSRHQAYGDGATMVADSQYYITRLTRKTFSPVTLDGAKAGLLEQGLAYHRSLGDQAGIFNVMGHPKTLSRYSLDKLDRFLERHREELTPVTFQDLRHLKPV